MNISLKDQQKSFEKKLKEKLEIQNKRYKRALNLIEKLNKINTDLLANQKIDTPTKKTKKKINSVRNNRNNRNNLNNFVVNKEFTKTLELFNKTFDFILEFQNNIIKKKYKEKIEKFLKTTINDEEGRIILMEAINMINEFLKNIDPKIGVNPDTKYDENLVLFDKILKKDKMEFNLNKLEDLLIKLKKPKKLLKHSDLNRLEEKIKSIKDKSFNLEKINLKDILFDLGKGKQVSIKQLLEKSNDITKFSKKRNPLIV